MQTTSSAPQAVHLSPGPLDLHVRLREIGGHFFSGRWRSIADCLTLFRGEIRGEALVFRMPWSLLNPNYWEPLTKER